MPRLGWIVLVALVILAGVLTVVFAPAYDARDAQNMTLWQAALLGTIEGVTEFLPISSTGHLLVAQQALGIGTRDAQAKHAADAFAICIQLGAILAVLGLYAGRVGSMTRGLFGRDPAGARLLGRVLCAFLPAAVLGLLLGEQIKAHLFGPWPVVLAWAVGGGAILAVVWWRTPSEGGAGAHAGKRLAELSVRAALVIGLLQCVAMWPGVSRSLVTIVGGVLAGLSLGAAVEFSFLLGLVTLSAATGYDVVRHGAQLNEAYSPPALLVGLCFAFVSALLAVHWMVGYLRSHGLALFGYYRLAVAALVVVLLLTGVLA